MFLCLPMNLSSSLALAPAEISPELTPPYPVQEMDLALQHADRRHPFFHFQPRDVLDLHEPSPVLLLMRLLLSNRSDRDPTQGRVGKRPERKARPPGIEFMLQIPLRRGYEVYADDRVFAGVVEHIRELAAPARAPSVFQDAAHLNSGQREGLDLNTEPRALDH